MIAHILTGQSLTVLLDGRTIAIPRSHANFDGILEATLAGTVDELRELIDVKATVANWANGKITVIDRELRYNGVPLNTSLTRKIIDFVRDGDERLAEPLCNFLDKVQQNPSFRAVSGLYDWVAASEMPIHPDGDILAWKIVKPDFHDYYSGKFDHSPGKVVEQPRNQCDENPDQTCSAGIHFCSFKYLPSYGVSGEKKIMLVKINPADVVAIPREYDTAKGRCCKLTVLQEVPTPEDFFPTRTVYFEPAPKFEVGQKWKDCDGDIMEITDIDKAVGRITATLNGVGEYNFDFEGDSYSGGYLKLVQMLKEEEEEEVIEEPVAPKYQLGQRWVCRDGQVREITELRYNDILYLDHGPCVFVENGRQYRGALEGQEAPQDLITLLRFKVGQVWEDDDGDEQLIVAVDIEKGEVRTVCENDGNNPFTFDLNGKECCLSLNHLVTDTVIDWTKPLETTEGVAMYLTQIEEDGPFAIVSNFPATFVTGNFFNLTTGVRFRGSSPTLRNVS